MIDPGSKVCVVSASTAILLGEQIEQTNARIYDVEQLKIGTEVPI